MADLNDDPNSLYIDTSPHEGVCVYMYVLVSVYLVMSMVTSSFVFCYPI